jgi:GAF domain-containing protein
VTLDRYAIIGGARSLIIAPVMDSGRFLGAIELVNPLDGQPFTESDGNAVTYIAEQFAEFVANRGVVTDPERIGARQLPEV